jgi:hypothetical protein
VALRCEGSTGMDVTEPAGFPSRRAPQEIR